MAVSNKVKGSLLAASIVMLQAVAQIAVQVQ